MDVLLQAEQRLAESDSSYYRALVDYMLAIRDVHRAKGSLLEYDGVSLAEGPWSTDAYRDALQRSRHFTERIIDYGLDQPPPLSRGPYLQESPEMVSPPGVENVTAPAPEGLPQPDQLLGTPPTEAELPPIPTPPELN